MEDGINGFIVPANDAQAVAEKMEWYVNNPLKADGFGLQAMQIKQRFSEDIIRDLWEQYLLQIQK